MGIVLRDLRSYQQLVHVLHREPAVEAVEFTYRAPLFKGNAAIREALVPGSAAIDKFDVYFEHGILDEEARVNIAQRFRRDWIRRRPGSEAQDVFAASGELLQFVFRLRPPHRCADPQAAMDAIARHPHDADQLAALRAGRAIDPVHLSAEIRIFIDHVFNPRRRKAPTVQAVMTGARTHDPVIVELMTTGGIPGYFVHQLEPPIDEVDGALVWLEG